MKITKLPILDCGGCGVCCTNQSSPPFGPEEFDKLPMLLRENINNYLAGPLYNDSHPCIWLDRGTGKCRNYLHRPQVCRDFKMGGQSCRKQRAEAFAGAFVDRRAGE